MLYVVCHIGSYAQISKFASAHSPLTLALSSPSPHLCPTKDLPLHAPPNVWGPADAMQGGLEGMIEAKIYLAA